MKLRFSLCKFSMSAIAADSSSPADMTIAAIVSCSNSLVAFNLLSPATSSYSSSANLLTTIG